MLHATTLLLPLLASLVVATAPSQHCGGPCEVPRGPDPVSTDPRFTLTMGEEQANWRYLWNWVWTENGTPKFRLEGVLREPPCRSFGYRRMFVSPAGNGFLVTGNAYAGNWLKDEPPPLFVFCDREGHRLVEVLLADVLTAEERQLGGCPGCECCKEVLHVFAEDPAVSTNGCFVELKAAGTRRPIAFFLPLGVPVLDRTAFETALAAAEWGSLTASSRKTHEAEIAALVERLLGGDASRWASANDALVAKGFLALDAVHKAGAKATTDSARDRAAAVERALRPWNVAGFDAMAIDLGLLGSLLSLRDEPLVRAVRARLDRILPQSKGMDTPACAAWIEAQRESLKWNVARGVYEGR